MNKIFFGKISLIIYILCDFILELHVKVIILSIKMLDFEYKKILKIYFWSYMKIRVKR